MYSAMSAVRPRPALSVAVLLATALASASPAVPEEAPESAACPLEGPLAEVCAAYDGADEADAALSFLQRRGFMMRQREQPPNSEASQPIVEDDQNPTQPSLSSGFTHIVNPCGARGDAKSCHEALSKSADIAFKALAAKQLKADNPYTHEEVSQFRERFTDSLRDGAKTIVDTRTVQTGYAEWRDLATKIWDKARPVVTAAMVAEINSKNLGWQAEYDPTMPTKSIEDAEKMLGLNTDEKEVSFLFNDTMRRHPQDLLEVSNWKAADGPFDGREHWPQCSDVMKHVRFQTCGNCWSHSSALVAESRLCIASAGKFHGRDAWLSQSYIAACRPDGLDYCAGGSGTIGFTTINLWGVPTGGSDFRGNTPTDAVTCLPQYLPHQENVKCPSKCSPYKNYPRPLKQDLFFVRFNPRGLHPQGPVTLTLVKQALMQEGPILIGFTAYQDFYAYKSGIYRPLESSSNQKIGGHAVTGMGFGPGYILCINSWGPTFGEAGAFKIAPEAIDFGYFLPGVPTFTPTQLPIPLPLQK